MNTIKFYLATSGRVADMHKDFPLFQNQFQNKLINVYVPTSILAPQYSAQYYIGQFSASEMPTDSELTLFVKNNTATGRNPINGDVIEFTYLGEVPSTYWLYIYNNNAWTSQQVDSLGTTNALDGTSVQIGMLANRRNGVIYESKKYFMRYLKTLTYQNVEYAMYERKMPKEFTKFVGQNENAPIIIFNVVNLDLEEKVITKVITSQSCNLDVMPSDELDQDPDIEQPSELERISALVDTLNAQMQTKQDKVDDSINTGAIVTTKNLVGAINDLSSGVENLNIQINVGDDEHPSIVSTLADHEARISTNTDNIATNTGDISDIKAEQIEQNSKIANLELIVGSGEDYIGTYPAVGEQPVTLDPNVQADFEQLSSLLTAFVLTERPSVESGDVVIYHQTIEHGTDKFYKFIYSAVASAWTFYEIPPMELADNETYGIVKGSFDASDTTTPEQISVSGGEFGGIYVIDGDGVKKQLASYINADHATLTTNTSNIAQNTLDIATNAGNINTLNTNYGKIVDGTTAVGYAKQAEKDSLNRNIAETYMTQNLGATKQQLYDYALPRTFNDVSFIGADNKFVDTIPDTQTALYTAQSTLVGDTTLFYVEKTNSNAYYELANKNSYSDTLYVSASIDCTVTFRATTQLYQNAEWITLNTELTEPVEMTQGVIRKVLFGSTLNSLTSVLNVTDGDKIKQTFEVITTTSTPITFSVYSNETYPSSFYLNTTSQTIYVAQGALGELPVYEIAGVYSNGTLTFTIPSERALNNNVQSFFKLSYSGEIPSNTNVVMQHNGVDITLVTPYNFGTQNETTVSDLEQLNCSSVENQYVWVFTTTTRETANEKYFVVDEENLDQLTQVLNSIVSNYVTTDTAQTISGIKTFSAQPVVKSIKFVNNTASPTGSAFEINNDNGYNAKIRMNGKGLMFTAGAVYPSEPSGEDFGSSGYKWRDIYLSGNLSDGTSSVSVDTLAKGILQPLTLTSTTLTDAQYTLLQNNDCILTADFASLTWAKKGTILTKPFEYSGTLRGIYITENKIGTYLINMTSKELGNGAQDIVLNQVASISADTYKNGSGNTYMQFRSNDINVTKDLIANSGSNSLGTSVYRWLDLYLSGKVDFGDGASVSKDSSNRINLNYGDSAKVKVGSAETIISNRIGADSDNTQDIGRSTVRWKDLYLAGNLTDATNSIAIADIASKSYVNTSVQTASANFRGNWATWTLVPSSASDYPVDYAGSTTPTVNDYIVVADASGYPVEQGEEALAGTWRFKYSGTWATDGKNGWLPEYQVNETPFTQAQLDALNSGIDSTKVAQIATNAGNITTIQGNYVTTNSAQDITAVKTIKDTGLDFKNSDASGSASWSIEADQYGQWCLYRTYNSIKTKMFEFNGNSIKPVGNGGSLGSASQKWDTLYLSGNLTDGTKSIAVADILSANSAITGATKCKITYDSKGLVTAGADLEATDIPNLTLSKISDVTATASELNVLDGITASTTELNYVDGVTSSIQTQLNGKQATLPTTTTAGQILKSTSTAGELEWANLPESTPTDVQISGTSITSNAVANIAVQGTYNASTNKIATMSEVPNITSTDVSITEVN